ncbi:MAG: beta-galactosidase trimerization domain-containing protein [Lentisphaeria bacterium]|nr:beta-galactosidase trimerization domain-containing protein [Lentisphaeria bacterium]
MFKTALPDRQIHLDFHTSEHCQDIGAEFSEEQFAAMLKRGRVRSINFFAYCHHGWCYYPDAVRGLSHPQLRQDLVGGMLNVCRRESINAEIYITVGWNDKASREHPEWCVRSADGKFVNSPPEGHPDSPRPWGWKRMCLNTDYLQVVLDVTRDVLTRYRPNGIWYDITGETICLCDKCRADMLAAGLNPDNVADQKQFAAGVYANYLEATTKLVWGVDPSLTVYHNGSSLRARHDIYPFDSHIEIESLPTGGWGYDHFPPNARYFTALNDSLQVVGMTGKFHKSWGEFGGFKDPVALRYECAQIASLGCLTCTGDQLHPSGYMDPETYRIIGDAYAYLEEREDWLKGARPYSDVAILGTMEMFFSRTGQQAIQGAGKMLMELQVPHAVIDETMDFAPYKLLILPDRGRLDHGVRDKLSRYLKKGGALLMSYESGVASDSWSFALDIGADCEGASPFDVEYLDVTDALSEGMVRSPVLLYQSGIKAKVRDAEVLAHTIQPQFNRTYAHFCSHRNTPPGGRVDWPAALQKGRVIYLAHPLFSMYDAEGMRQHRQVVGNCLQRLYAQPLLQAALPSCGRSAVTWQATEKRHVLHFLYAAPVKRGAVEVIEDVVTLQDVAVSFRTSQQPRRVVLAPEGSEVPHRWQNGVLSFTLPKLVMAQLVAVEY